VMTLNAATALRAAAARATSSPAAARGMDAPFRAW
jgi:hypothetical protein